MTSETVVSKTFAPAEGALIGFATMVYDIIYLRQGHGSEGFDQEKLVQLLDNANIGNWYNLVNGINYELVIRI